MDTLPQDIIVKHIMLNINVYTLLRKTCRRFAAVKLRIKIMMAESVKITYHDDTVKEKTIYFTPKYSLHDNSVLINADCFMKAYGEYHKYGRERRGRLNDDWYLVGWYSIGREPSKNYNLICKNFATYIKNRYCSVQIDY